MNSPTEIDASLQAVASDIRKLDPDGARTARVLRETLDQLYDGQRTGRYRPDQLYKTEKTHCGTLVEINLQREFKFQDGIDLDYQIAGVDVDCKFSQTLNGWMIPPEARRKLCLVVWAEDTATPHWSMGLVRVTDDRLNNGSNRDAKSTLNAAGRKAIVWLFQERPLPSNVLLQLDRPTVDRIMSLKSGQKRINELFRMALCRIVSRTVIATVAQQDDYMKRIRANGALERRCFQKGSLFSASITLIPILPPLLACLCRAQEIRFRCASRRPVRPVLGLRESKVNFGKSPCQVTHRRAHRRFLSSAQGPKKSSHRKWERTAGRGSFAFMSFCLPSN